MNTTIENFAAEISRFLHEGADQQTAALADIISEESERAVELLREKSPERTGDYAKSWTLKKTGKTAKGIQLTTQSGFFVTVYNKDHYRLTHLLEKGAIRGKAGVMPAQPHITPAFEEIKKNIESKIGG